MCRGVPLYGVTLVVVVGLCLGISVLLGVTGSRRERYRRVSFEGYVNCPERYEKWGRGKPELASSQCVHVKDPMGYVSTAYLEETSPRPGAVNSDLFTNGLLATVDDPIVVLLGSVYTLAVISGIYFIAAFVHLCLYPESHLGILPNTSPKSSSLYSYGMRVYGGLLILIVIAYIVALCVYAGFQTQWRPITCKSYVRCDNQYPDVDCVITIDELHGSKEIQQSLLGRTRQPDVLPQPCWTNGDEAEFYNPKDLLLHFSVVAGSSFLVISILLIAHWAIFTEREQSFTRHSRSIAPAPPATSFTAITPVAPVTSDV